MEKKLPSKIWLKNSNVIGADVLSKSGLAALCKARTYEKEGYSMYRSEEEHQALIAPLIEAIEWYASQRFGKRSHPENAVSDLEWDDGETARKALENYKKQTGEDNE